MNPCWLSLSELQSLPTSYLTEMYHQAQLSAVADATHGNMVAALSWLDLTINCRSIVMTRYARPDNGHINFYWRMVDERNNIARAIYLQDGSFRFECGRLVGNAIDYGMQIPRELWPVNWYYEDYVNTRNRSRSSPVRAR